MTEFIRSLSFQSSQESDQSGSLLLPTKGLKLIKYKIFSLKIYVLFNMSCSSPTVSVLKKIINIAQDIN